MLAGYACIPYVSHELTPIVGTVIVKRILFIYLDYPCHRKKE